MITADYCGTGHAFTRTGEPLLFNTHYWQRFSLPHPHLEAIWTASGAACLSEPRRAAEEPGILAVIQAECAAVGHTFAACVNLPGWNERGYGVSASP